MKKFAMGILVVLTSLITGGGAIVFSGSYSQDFDSQNALSQFM